MGREFRPGAANVLRAAALTYLRTWEGWLYLAAVQDTYGENGFWRGPTRTLSEHPVGRVSAGDPTGGLFARAALSPLTTLQVSRFTLRCHSWPLPTAYVACAGTSDTPMLTRR